jgi:hypothetical protein
MATTRVLFWFVLVLVLGVSAAYVALGVSGS